MKRFQEAQLLLANHKTCLKHSILERMFDFKNVHKEFVSKTTWRMEKMTDEEKQILISFYNQNSI